MKIGRHILWRVALCVVLMAAAVWGAAPAGAEETLSTGQSVYVPVYSHIYSGNRENPIYLAATLSIRNIDMEKSLTLVQVDYFDSDGRLIKQYLQQPAALSPMASLYYVIKESDTAGGAGAKFIVRWKSDDPMNAPLIESIMIGTKSQSGISFTSQGKVLVESKNN